MLIGLIRMVYRFLTDDGTSYMWDDEDSLAEPLTSVDCHSWNESRYSNQSDTLP